MKATFLGWVRERTLANKAVGYVHCGIPKMGKNHKDALSGRSYAHNIRSEIISTFRNYYFQIL